VGAVFTTGDARVIPLATGLSYVDLKFAGVERIIATAVLHGPGGVALIDPGPSTTLPILRATLESAGIRMSDVTALVITHIHLDHAGASGTLVQENPRLRVYVHEKGAPHMVDPSRLLGSAARLYGDAMDRLWGEVRPVPAECLTVLQGGEHVTAGGRSLHVEYTPGHASHHVSYLDAAAGVAFVGDTLGIRIVTDAPVVPATPPPDVDLPAWAESLARIEAWRSDSLFVTHFGPYTRASSYVAEFRDRLEHAASLAKQSLARPGTDPERETWFLEQMRAELARTTTESNARASELAGRFDLSWRGLARYWKNQEKLRT
jgi:glyoxylase-like metal-dependent hydrolase (beta-lactamase superfamily II)